MTKKIKLVVEIILEVPDECGKVCSIDLSDVDYITDDNGNTFNTYNWYTIDVLDQEITYQEEL